MEKVCEFCKSLRPILYCKADSAHLCLSCDAKVHSANALSSKHIRRLLCEHCKYRPAHVRCFDHKKFICSRCDRSLNEAVASQLHRKQKLTSYMGSPSPKDFAALWGFELNEFDDDDTDFRSRFGSASVFGSNGLQNTFWSQNMQDLGVCEELDCFDDLNIPDVDLTFKNYEELFRGDQDVTRFTFSSTSFDISDDGSSIPSQGCSGASSSHITSSTNMNGDFDSSYFVRSSFPPYDSSDFGNTAIFEARKSAMMRYKEKKKFHMTEKKPRYTS